MRNVLAGLGLLLSWIAAAQGQPPAMVAEATRGLMQECRGFGGQPTLRPEFQTSLDLNADQVADYILDVSALNCDGAASALCAGVGCPVLVFVSSPSGYRQELEGNFVQGWEIDRATAPPTLVFSKGMAACGPRARTDCVQRYQWNGTTMAEARAGAARPPPQAAPSGWEIRPVANRAPVALTPGPGVVETIAFLCNEGVPVAALTLKARPPPGKTTLTMAFRAARVEVGLEQPAGASNRVWYADLRGSPMPRLLANQGGQARVLINGGIQGNLALAGAGPALRQALEGCYRF